MRNRQIDLDNHLFAELERLGDEELTGEDLKAEIARARAMANVAAQINESRSLALEAQKFLDSAYDVKRKLPEGF